jgi:hypothetical protein
VRAVFGPKQPAVVDSDGRRIDTTVGWLVVLREDELVAVPYDWRRLRVMGEAIPVFPCLPAVSSETDPPPAERGGRGAASLPVLVAPPEAPPTLLEPRLARVARPADTGPVGYPVETSKGRYR